MYGTSFPRRDKSQHRELIALLNGWVWCSVRIIIENWTFKCAHFDVFFFIPQMFVSSCFNFSIRFTFCFFFRSNRSSLFDVRMAFIFRFVVPRTALHYIVAINSFVSLAAFLFLLPSTFTRFFSACIFTEWENISLCYKLPPSYNSLTISMLKFLRTLTMLKLVLNNTTT